MGEISIPQEQLNNETTFTAIASFGKTLQFFKEGEGIVKVVFKGEDIITLSKAQIDALKNWI